MVISVNQLSIYGAIAEKIAELPVGQGAPGKPVASGQLDEQEILTQPPLAELQANGERQGNLLQKYEQRFEKLSEVIQTMLRSRFETSRSLTILLCSSVTESWIRIVNGIDKLVREALPIQEEEKTSGKPVAKARPILKPSSTSGWDFTPMEQRQMD